MKTLATLLAIAISHFFAKDNYDAYKKRKCQEVHKMKIMEVVQVDGECQHVPRAPYYSTIRDRVSPPKNNDENNFPTA